MNGQKRRSKKLVLDSGKVNHFLQVSVTLNHFNMSDFYFKNLIFIFSNFFRKKLKRNESQIEDSFQI